MECVHKQEMIDLRWRPLRSSSSILIRRIIRRPLRSSAILYCIPLSSRIFWRPLRSSSILISFFIPVIQFGFLAPRKIDRIQPFIR